MAEIVRTLFQLRRGYEAVWQKNNPVLASGEPGFCIDKNAIKIGDGQTAWNDLTYIGGEGKNEGGVFNAQTHFDFPSIGSVDMIYKAEAERKIYQWNAMDSKYESLSGGSFDPSEIKLINGGNANGTD